ncbi:recombination regulator RecX [Pulveribacter sp.]|uniref:recombination regulator RecX n=1 Tax=Pulveribacter sp. TaxID=2678893 RepID=UPI00289CA681|nr:recombination regulator RecX [Pulveribacter sp.]
MGFQKLSLKGRALRLLAQREHSRSELQAKLARYVQEGEDLAAILDELQAKDFINEGRVAESVVNRRAARLGTQRVLQELRRKGLDEELVRAAGRQLAGSELERARAVWRQRFGAAAETPAERARQMRFLAARGFAADVVRRVVRGAGEDDEGMETGGWE